VCESLEIGSEPNLRLTECKGLRAVGALAAAVLSLAIISGGPVRGQESASNVGSAINLGSRGLSPSSEGRPEQAENKLEYEVRAGFTTDYIYRGTTQTDHKPAVGAAVELTFGQLYAGVTMMSVKLPTQPSAEIDLTGGIRKMIADINFDLGVTYFLYPGEILVGGAPGIDYGRQLFAPIRKSVNPSVLPEDLLTRQTTPTPVPGAGMQPLEWVTTSRAACSQWTSACRLPAVLVTRGSDINLLG
jgi:hypothetical protein